MSNISNEDDELYGEDKKVKIVMGDLFSVHNCIIYVIAFLVSMVSIRGDFVPFGIAMLGACIGCTIPMFVVFIVSLLSTAIFYGIDGFINFLCTSVIFFILIAIFKPRVSSEERNEEFNVGVHLFSACFIFGLIKNIINGISLYNIFIVFVASILVYIFYKIFVNGLVVFRDIGEKKAFTSLELITASIVIVIAFSFLNNISIFGLGIESILLALLVIVLGWRNGALVRSLSRIFLKHNISINW